jgi:hypothetical protein
LAKGAYSKVKYKLGAIMKNKKTILMVAIGSLTLMLLSACNFSGSTLRVGEMQRESRNVEMLDA